MSLFDQPSGPELADEAIQRAKEHADREWYGDALGIVAALARRGEAFTTDDVWAQTDPTLSTHEPRALGAVMRDARKRGWIVPTSEYRQSSRLECHGRPVRVWRAAGR